MNKYKTTILLVFSLTLSTGCVSRLNVLVDVYTGPLINTMESHLSLGMGIARGIRDNAITLAGSEYSRANRSFRPFVVIDKGGAESGRLPNFLGPDTSYVKLNTPDDPSNPHASFRHRVYMNKHARQAQLFAGIAEYYDELRIDHAFEELVEAGGPFGPRDNAVTARGIASQDKLIAKLLAFSTLCRTIAVPLGSTEIVKPWPFGDGSMQQGTTTMDEAGQIMQLHVNSLIAAHNSVSGGEDAEISAVMRSQAPSTLLTLRREGSLLSRHLIDQVYRSRYWKNINEVDVTGSGEVEYMLVKDEIGNWHLKQATVDPTKILNAINTVSVAAVRIAAVAAGISIPGGQQTPNSVAEASEASESVAASSEAASANEKARVVTVLQDLLIDIIGAQGDKTQMISAIDSAIGKL